MKLLSPKSLINIFEYEKVRDDFRKEIILYKKSRRLSLGPNITVTFENERTLLFQILNSRKYWMKVLLSQIMKSWRNS